MSVGTLSNATHVACYPEYYLQGDANFISPDQWTCANFLLCDCPPLKADPDIAGVGVVLSFAFSASLTLVATVICLMLCRSNSAPFTVNPLDAVFRNIFCEPLQTKLGPQRTRRWVNVCYDMVVCLSDQQLVTGIAMMIAGLKKLHDETITVYHLSIVTDLVWFSSNTHLCSLGVIGFFSVESFKKDAPARIIPKSTQFIVEPREKFVARLPRVARVVLMVFLACLLLYMVLISGYEDWPVTYNCPVSCIVEFPRGGVSQDWMIANIVLIVYAYPKAIFLLWHGGRRVWFEQWRHIIVDNRHLGQSEPPRHWAIKSARKIYHCLWYYLASDTGNVAEQIAWHIVGYVTLFYDREKGHSVMRYFDMAEEIATENSWGFGQLVPIVLLLLPALQFLESIAAHWNDEEEENETVVDGTRIEPKKDTVVDVDGTQIEPKNESA